MSKRAFGRKVMGLVASTLGATMWLSLAACNQVTGVDDLRVNALGSGVNGQGGNGGGSASGAGGSTSTGGVVCQYPMGSYNNKVGAVVKPGLTWEGFADDSDTAGTVAMEDYYDCDGSRGINAILILTSATWCGACEQEASELKGTGATYTQWKEMGIRVITLMIEDINQGQAATVTTAEKWKTKFKLANAVVADPKFSFAPLTGGSIGLPYQVVVDPRTMTIVDIQEGYSGEYASTLALAKKNGAK